jgi:hypothetical protein
MSAGCGGKKATPSEKTTSSERSSTTTDCDRKGITTTVAREGACVVNGSRITVADKAHWLRMKDYDVRVDGLRTAATLGKFSANTFETGGQFIVVTLRVKNTGRVPRAFDTSSNLVFLLVDQQQFAEIPDAETESPDSFRSHGGPIDSGQTRSGTIVFDLPPEHVPNLRARGSDLVFLNFADGGKGLPYVGTTPAIGFIRLWK